MTVLLILIPAALFLGLLGLAAFMWALKSRQFEDLDGAAWRILLDDDRTGPEDDKDSESSLDPGQGPVRSRVGKEYAGR